MTRSTRPELALRLADRCSRQRSVKASRLYRAAGDRAVPTRGTHGPARTRTLSGSRSSPTRRLSGRARTRREDPGSSGLRCSANAGDPPPGGRRARLLVGCGSAGYVAAAAQSHAPSMRLLKQGPAMMLARSAMERAAVRAVEQAEHCERDGGDARAGDEGRRGCRRGPTAARRRGSRARRRCR